MMGTRPSHPNHVPRAANSLKSPYPMPSFARCQLECPIHQPQREIACRSAHHSEDAGGTGSTRNTDASSPAQSNGKVKLIRQQRRIPIDKSQCNQNSGETAPSQTGRRQSPVLHAPKEQPACEQFHQRIPGADAGAAFRALAAQKDS